MLRSFIVLLVVFVNSTPVHAVDVEQILFNELIFPIISLAFSLLVVGLVYFSFIKKNQAGKKSYDEANTTAREIIPGIDKLNSEPSATHTPSVGI